MRHDWIFAVLSDLQDYALSNGLPDLASKAAETLAVARREVAVVQQKPCGDRIPKRFGRVH